jgi:uncharacterized membrane protein YoaK (UPF0700 family)
VFSAFMTGNVVFLAAGLFSHRSELSLHAALALCAFGVGAWATASVMPRQNPSVLWPALVTAGLIACALVQLTATWTVLGGDAAHWSATRTERRRPPPHLRNRGFGRSAGDPPAPPHGR